MNYWATSQRREGVILKPLLLPPWVLTNLVLGCELCYVGATCQETDQWEPVTCLQPCEWLGSGPGGACHPSKLEFHPPSQALK